MIKEELEAAMRLENLTPEEFVNLSTDQLSIQEEQQFWQQACQKCYQLTALPGQNSRDFFWGEYVYRKAISYPENSLGYSYLLLEAAQFNNFNALATLSQNAIQENNFDHALMYAEKSSLIYGTPGHLLVTNVYREFCLQYPQGSAEAKGYAQKALKYLNLALAAANTSVIAIHNTKCELKPENIEHFRQEFIQHGQLTEDEIQACSANGIEQLTEQ